MIPDLYSSSLDKSNLVNLGWGFFMGAVFFWAIQSIRASRAKLKEGKRRLVIEREELSNNG